MYIHHNLDKIFILVLNCLIVFIPFSLIFGNLITNLNIILICLVGLVYFNFKIFETDNRFNLYVIFAFFIYLILISFFQNINNIQANPLYKDHILKSLFFFRFLFLYLIVNKICELNKLNLKFLFTSWALIAFIVSIDIVIQITFGKNLLGFPVTANRPSGLFGQEHIAGSWLQKFSLFFIFGIPFFYKIKHNLFILLSSIFFLIVILSTGNRMAAVVFFSSIILFFLLEKKYKEFLIISIFFISIVSIISFVFPSNNKLNNSIRNFYVYSKNIFIYAPELFYNNKIKNQTLAEYDGSGSYLITFNSAVQLWKKNKIFGGGLKSFRLNCKFERYQICNSHPHNYFLELMVDSGLVGLTLIYIIFFLNIRHFIKSYISNKYDRYKFISIPFFLIILFEFFPIRSTGSFFTTNNAAIVFLVLSIFISLNKNIIKK